LNLKDRQYKTWRKLYIEGYTIISIKITTQNVVTFIMYPTGFKLFMTSSGTTVSQFLKHNSNMYYFKGEYYFLNFKAQEYGRK
jgi:hypothetical protein